MCAVLVNFESESVPSSGSAVRCAIPFVSQGGFLDRLVPCLPPLRFSSQDFLPEADLPEADTILYKRLRVYRAIGALPSHLLLLPGHKSPQRFSAVSGGDGGGIGGENLAVGNVGPCLVESSGRENGAGSQNRGDCRPGQFTGDISVATWNGQAVFCSDPYIHEEKVSFLAKLAKGHDAVMIQEAHGTAGMYEAWAGLRGYTAFFSVGVNTG